MNALKISPKIALGTNPTTIPMATPDSTLNVKSLTPISLSVDVI